jgi:hypothetical protein
LELADVIISDKYLGRVLPSQFTDDDYKQIYYIRAWMYANIEAGNVSRVLNGPIIKAILANMQRVIDGSQPVKKYSSYCVHDLNIAPLLTYLGMTSPACIKK